ncbi:MAG: Fic/DOC family protein [Stenotrophobium sp.]
MFDPFKDFETAGYLRNVEKEKDPTIIKMAEHEAFTSNLPKAIDYLSSKAVVAYEDFLEVHRILFSDFYPWAGQDRAKIAPNLGISKAGTLFCHPADIRRAVDEGLRLAQAAGKMSEAPGKIMGLFAYGHPFLDGNGRTMLVVHVELAHRAGYSIAWHSVDKATYLKSLAEEISHPDRGVLDVYLLQFKTGLVERAASRKSVLSVKGLDGLDENNQVDGDLLSNKTLAEKYRKFDEQRGYTYATEDEQIVCSKCNLVPCVCGGGGPPPSEMKYG